MQSDRKHPPSGKAPDFRKSLRESLRGPQPSHFQSFLATCAFAPDTLKACPVFRGCGVLRTVLAPSALHFASGLRMCGKNGIFKGANLRFAVENAFPVPPSSHSPANCADACSRVRPLRSTSCCPQGLVVASLLPPEIPKNFRRRVSSVKKR